MTTSNQANRQIARAAGTVMAAILFGQIAGLVSKSPDRQRLPGR